MTRPAAPRLRSQHPPPFDPSRFFFSSSETSRGMISILAITLLFVSSIQVCSGAYYGKLIGKLSEFHHGVSGEVYAVDGRTLYIKDFTYDGEGPTAYFYAGNSKAPITNGFRLRDEKGTTNVLKRYRKKGITLTLPEGKTLANIKWFCVWCDEYAVNFGEVKIPRGFDFPRPQKLAALSGIHGVNSEPVVIVDAQTLLVPNFSYDGEAPDAKFWAGSGSNPTPQGIKIPDENGKVAPLRKYDHKTIVLTLPGDLTVHQLGHFGVWCEAFTVDFGHVKIPQSLNIPPSLKMLGVSPQSRLNCEVLEDDLAFEVRWAVAGDSIVVQLVAKLEDGQYMSFGLSPDHHKSVMVGGDVVVAWVDKQTLQGYAVDYILDAKSQCSGGRGSCPDTRIQENSNSVRLLNAAMVNGYSIVTYQRPLKATDELDLSITTNGSQAIIWAIGPLNERKEVSFHSSYLKKNQLIEFGRSPQWNCLMPDQEQDDREANQVAEESQEIAATTRKPQRVPPTPAPAPTNGAWSIPPIRCNEPEDGVFYAQMGPTGGKHGYPAITGHVGWGIAWYINGLLIPEINVVRGKKYTFVVEGGSDPDTPARYHPFYITDDPIGGYQHKTPEEKSAVKIFAGIKRIRGSTKLTGVGRLCNWVPDQSKPQADEFNSFGAYQRTLTLECDPGEPGIVEWTPDDDTPDTVYYQCFTHRHLGWKINVLDDCDAAEGSASETHEIRVALSGSEVTQNAAKDLEGSSSLRALSKVTAGAEFYKEHRDHVPNPSFVANQFPGNGNNYRAQLIQHTVNNNNNNPIYASFERFQSFEDHAPRSTYSSATHSYHRNSNNNNNNNIISNNKHVHSLTRNKNFTPANYQGQAKVLNEKPTVTPSYELLVTGRRGYDRETYTSNTRSKLIPDSRTQPVVTTNDMKYGINFPYAQGSQSPSPSPSQSQSHTRPVISLGHQMMVLRRPVQNRRPMSPATPLPTSAHSNFPMMSRIQYVTDRKKPIYRTPSSSSPQFHVIPRKRFGMPIAKLTKTDATDVNSRASQTIQKNVESKMSQVDTNVVTTDNFLLPGFLQDRRPSGRLDLHMSNGFDPDSVVIEEGFKPVVRDSNVTENRKGFEITDEDLTTTENRPSRPSANFEPMFVPSPPDRNRNKNLKKKNATPRGKTPRRDDTVEDMETAAAESNAYYLPPDSSGSLSMPEKPPSPSPAPPQTSLSSVSTLVTYDGKEVLDSTLAKSIPKVPLHPRGRLSSSDILSRTPQFGQFRGELPPPIPGDIRPEDIPQLDPRQLHQSRSISTEEGNRGYPTVNITSEHTKLIPVKRTRRSSGLLASKAVKIEDQYPSNLSTNAQVSPVTANEHDYHHLEIHGMDESSPVPGAGQLMLANFEYVLLTVLLYFVI